MTEASNATPDRPADPRLVSARWRPFRSAAGNGLRWPTSRLALLIELAIVLRVLAADAVEWYVHQRATTSGGAADAICVFPDTRIYWELARTILEGAPFEILTYGDIPHFSLRTPGYPLFLAGIRFLFGNRPLAVRLVQAALGGVTVWLVFLLTRQVLFRNAQRPNSTGPVRGLEGSTFGRESIPLVAAALTALHPYAVLMSALILSEALFVPLMLGSLWGVAVIWKPTTPRPEARVLIGALAAGVCGALAVLVRPSWLLFLPTMIGIWFAMTLARPGPKPPKRVACAALVIMAIGFVAVMGPWWYRNTTIYGRFVPTALWMGASLYDGLNPRATGASDMSFLDDADVWPLDEEDQDALLTRRAIAFVGRKPGRAVWLAVVKLGRFWKPWPDAEGFGRPARAVLAALVSLPFLALLAVGAWNRAKARDLKAWLLLGGPLVSFCLLHMVFTSSMRYRIPGEIPAMGLAAIGFDRMRAGSRRVSDWEDR
jgi:hypothetical protein